MTTPTARNVLIDWVTLHAWDERDPFPRLVDNLLAELNRFGLAIVPRVAGMVMEEAGRCEMGMEEWEGTASRVWAAMVAAAEQEAAR